MFIIQIKMTMVQKGVSPARKKINKRGDNTGVVLGL